jgi:hypothetical protein
MRSRTFLLWLGGPDNYVARNTFQANAAGVLTSEADDRLGRAEEANVFLLASGEIDDAWMTHPGTTGADGWPR